jgi:hypothetical protein
MRIRALAFVLLMLGQLFAQDPPKPTVRECRANLNRWLPLFHLAFADAACNADGTPACPFAAGLRTLSTSELLDIPAQAEACIPVDRKRRYEWVYGWVSARAENIVVERTGYFLEDADQMDAYTRWEDKQRGIVPPPKGGPDTVAKEQ